jgi:uncharacterized protein YbjT (DUF2867 family)
MILVTGATGTVGRPLIEVLSTAGVEIRAVTRNPQTAGLPDGVEVVRGDPSRPDTITPALRGVTALFLHPRAVGDAAFELLALAREQGVRRVVALSAINIDDPLDQQPSRYNGDHNKEAEDAAVASGLEWVSLRSSSFASNTLQAWGAQIRAGDVVRYVYAAFEESLIDERDLAEVAGRALLSDDLVGRRLMLTGPQSLSHAEMVATIGEVIGRPLRFQEIEPEVLKRSMIANGFSGPFVKALLARYVREVGQAAPLTGEVKRILGRSARTYAGWVADHADAFRIEQAGQAASDNAHGRRGDRSSRHTYKGADR